MESNPSVDLPILTLNPKIVLHTLTWQAALLSIRMVILVTADPLSFSLVSMSSKVCLVWQARVSARKMVLAI